MIKVLQEKAGCKMQMIQDGPFASAPEKPLRMTGFPNNCKVSPLTDATFKHFAGNSKIVLFTCVCTMLDSWSCMCF